MATNRLTGLHGTVQIGAASGGTELYNSADIFDWELEIMADMEDMSALEDDWEVVLPNVGRWTARASKLVATQAFMALLSGRVVTKAPVHITLKRGGATVAGASNFLGECFISRTGVTNPRGRMVENIEFTGTGAPSMVAAS